MKCIAVRHQNATWRPDARRMHSVDSKLRFSTCNGVTSVATSIVSGTNPAEYTAIAPARRGAPLT